MDMRACIFPLLLSLFAPLTHSRAAEIVVLTPSDQQDLSKADEAYNNRRFIEALPLYERLAGRQIPTRIQANAQLRVGYSHYLLKDTATARVAWQAVADRFPSESRAACEALLRVGHLALKEYDFGAATTAFGRAANNYANAPEAAVFAAEAACRLGSIYLRQAEDNKLRRVPDATSAKASSYFEMSRSAFERVVASFPGQTEYVSEAKMQLAALKLEYALQRKGSYTYAVAACDTFLEEYPEDIQRVPTVRIIRAEALYYLNRLDEAIAEIGRVQEKYPTSGQPAGTSQFLLANCYASKGDLPKAIAEYQRFLDNVTVSFSSWEERPAAMYQIGMALRSLGRNREALAEFALLKSRYPDSFFVSLAGSVVLQLEEVSK